VDRISQAKLQINRMAQELLQRQSPDGAWRFCFENGTVTDALLIIVLRSLEIRDEALIGRLHRRILSKQERNGAWKLYHDEKDGNLSATIEAYYALLYSGYSHLTDEAILNARRFILSRGGLHAADSMLTKVILACTGQYPWPTTLRIPLELLLLPSSFPVSFYDFVGYARVHFTPVLVMADRRFALKTTDSPDLSDLFAHRPFGNAEMANDSPQTRALLSEIAAGLRKLTSFPGQLHRQALQRAERFMLDRIEADGSLYSYASATTLMIYALLALGYPNRHPVIMQAVQGLKSLVCADGEHILVQNSTSTVWDTALISHALQESGVAAASNPIRQAGAYLLSRQQRKRGDWSIRNDNPVPGGWGFSDINTINPDVDDSTAALRAIDRLTDKEPGYEEAFSRGLNWVISMQNDDGGWPAFEKNTDKKMLTWLPIKGADAVTIDPSTADLTGRTLEFLGNKADLDMRHTFIQRAVQWLVRHQEANGSWYGRWGICYVYGTWAAITGMLAVGAQPDHQSVVKGVEWLKSVQRADGGWGESCDSDRLKRFVPLSVGTPSQTAWALDALIAVSAEPTPEIERGIDFLLRSLQRSDWTVSYPTGAGLPGIAYIHYHSYKYIWPLLALSRYTKKFGR